MVVGLRLNPTPQSTQGASCYLRSRTILMKFGKLGTMLDLMYFSSMENLRCCYFLSSSLSGSMLKAPSTLSITNFSLIKAFKLQIKRSSPQQVLWTPPMVNWIKGNIDDVSTGTPNIAACGGLCRGHNANHISSFACYLGKGMPFLLAHGSHQLAIYSNWPFRKYLFLGR